jgi:hypothetical protein
MPVKISVLVNESNRSDLNRNAFKVVRVLGNTTTLAWILIVLGAIVRLRIYLACRSLWSDEAMLTLNLLHKPLKTLLTKRLDYQQAAPPGFLLLEKCVIAAFGSSEYSLRLLPLLSGIVSIFLVYLLAKRLTTIWPTIVAVAMTAFSKGLIEQTVFVKQYQTDVAITLLILLTAIPLLGATSLRIRSLLIFSITSANAIWCSHPAAFTVVGVSTALVIHHAISKRWKDAGRIALASLPAAISLLAEYFLILRSLESSNYLHTFWISGFLPLPLRFGSAVKWFVTVAPLLMVSPGGYKIWGVAPACFILGLIYLWRRDKPVLLLLLMPIVVVMFAAAIQKYPFTSRLALFALPPLFLVSSIGIGWLLQRPKFGICKIVGVILALLLLIPSMARACVWMVEPEPLEEIKPVLAYVHDHMQPNDILCIYRPTQPAFFYYQSRAGLSSAHLYLCQGTDAKSQEADVHNLIGHSRVWVIVTHDHPASEVSEARPMMDELIKDGTVLEKFSDRDHTARASLYDLSKGSAH